MDMKNIKLINNIALLAENIKNKEFVPETIKEKSQIIINLISEFQQNLSQEINKMDENNEAKPDNVANSFSEIKNNLTSLSNELENWIPQNSKFADYYAIPLMVFVIIVSFIIFCYTCF